MEKIKFNNFEKFKQVLPEDNNGKKIDSYLIRDVCFLKNYSTYPNVIGYSKKEKKIVEFVDEEIMSLKKHKKENNISFSLNKTYISDNNNYFCFNYNSENYYHFIYDTLPYLISYFNLKNDIKDLKILTNFPVGKKKFFTFFDEFLEILQIKKENIEIIDSEKIYNKVFVSESYTHNKNKSIKPRNEIYEFYNQIVQTVKVNFKSNTPKKIYISRRTWVHNDFSNIGTNYTTKRKMVNEDRLVNFLTKKGFTEIFTENLSTIEKLNIFYNAEIIVGSIGGGLCNVLFCNNNQKLISIISPDFLKINKRFLHSFKNVEHYTFKDCNHNEKTFFKKYMRVQSFLNKQIIGEIIEVEKNNLKIIVAESDVSGWRLDSDYKITTIKQKKVVCLDNGLNSEFKINMSKFKKKFFKILN